ncbi:MAG: O-antigen ligase family protein [Spirochaetaceae bacterium]|nr:O-antigen ligase family protein [Spirochaetaceae bacterium]MCF7947179.1 O-antigen ligase family protein [Spirochaetia bacterium]MCF7950044.1 O-antigen ligase family protein [Spirochaetaceae bacterium]
MKNDKGLYYYFIYSAFIFVVVLSMPFRGEISVIDSARVARDYILLILGLIVYYDIYKNSNHLFYIKLFIFISFVTSLQIIVNSVNPSLVESFFPELRAREGYKLGFQRNHLLSHAMLFPHISTIYLICKSQIKKLKMNETALLLIFFVASGLQGFRIYFVSLTAIIVIVKISKISFRKIFLYLFMVLVFVPAINLLDTYYLNNQIKGKFITTIYEISGSSQGTLQGRFNRDNIYMYPMFYEKPYFGWGFIYYGSEYGKEIGMMRTSEDRRYSLYSIDSGYLTVLIQFGIIGSVIMLLLISKQLKILNTKNNYLSSTVFWLWIFLLMSLPTHGAFFSIHGLLPLSIFMGLMARPLSVASLS